MASTKQSPRSLRTLIVLAVVVFLAFGALLAGTKWSDASLTPNLALDLEGGTQIILTPVTTDGSKVTTEDINEAIRIIRQRVDGQNISEAEITSQGGNNIVVGIPGRPSDEVLQSISQSSQMNFRPVLMQAAGYSQEELDKLVGSLDPDAKPSGEATDKPSGESTEKPAVKPTDKPVVEPTTTPAANETTTSSSMLPSNSDTVGVTTVSNPVRADATDAPEAPVAISANPDEPVAISETADEPDAISATADPKADDKTDPKAEEKVEPAVVELTGGTASDLALITPAVLKEFEALNCLDPSALKGGRSGEPDKVLVTCQDDGSTKYIVGPVEIPGTDISRASSGLSQQGQVVSNTWAVSMEFNKVGGKAFTETTGRLSKMDALASLGYTVAPNQFAMVLDGLVISAPSVAQDVGAISGGKAEITGNFTQTSATALANQLNFGALPLTFDVQSQLEISATLGSEQLQKGLIAGLIGLLLVVIYSLIQYRVLGMVTVASLSIAAAITYAAVALLSWKFNYRLSLPGVAGLIIAIGITADSFIVYFERIRDELRDGRSLALAIDKGWDRAKRTILASDMVNFLAAIVLYYLAVGGVRGFAFTLGLTTVVDLVVVFFFTHPLLKLVSKTKFFAEGHRWSGLDPRQLGVRGPRYAGRGRVSSANTSVSGATKADDDARVLAPAGSVPGAAVGEGGRRLTIAERRALAAAGPVEAEPTSSSTEGDAASGDQEGKL